MVSDAIDQVKNLGKVIQEELTAIRAGLTFIILLYGMETGDKRSAQV